MLLVEVLARLRAPISGRSLDHDMTCTKPEQTLTETQGCPLRQRPRGRQREWTFVAPYQL